MRSSTVQPDIYNYLSPNPYFVYGESEVTFGFEVRGDINGIGLVSRGLVWQLFDLWTDVDYLNTTTTTWTEATGASITTAWTAVQYGVWGEYSP